MKVAIYVRVSTEDQELAQQLDTCLKFCEYKGWNDYEVYKEVQSSTKIRPIFEGMLREAKEGKFQAVVLFRFDRAWRSTRQFIMDFDMLQNRGIDIVSVNEGLDPTTPIGKAMVTILVALAELERANLSLATKHRLQALKNMGKPLGRRKGSKDKKPRRKIGYLIREAKKRGGKKEVEKLLGIVGK